MKILLISYWSPPAKAIGARRWGDFFQLSEEDNDVEMTVLTANWQGSKEKNNIFYLGEEVISKPFYSVNHKIGYKDMLLHPSLIIRSLDSSIESNWYHKTKEWIAKDTNDYDVIISSFGPIASVLLGSYAKKKYKKPHFVDLRDLVSIQGQKNIFPFINFLDKKLDKYIMRDVDAFFSVSPTGTQKAKKFYKKEVYTIYNGLKMPIKKSKVDLSLNNKTSLTLLYMGTLGISRNPSVVLTFLENYAKLDSSISFKIKFASQDSPFDFITKKLFSYIDIEWLGYLSLGELEKEKKTSDVFLLLEDLQESGNENLTGKIFEYFYGQKPIMLSAHKDSDIVTLLNLTNAGMLVNSIEDIKSFITKKRYLNIEECNKFTRVTQYHKMKQVLEEYNV